MSWRNAIALLEVPTLKSGVSHNEYGTGIYLGENLFITACHVTCPVNGDNALIRDKSKSIKIYWECGKEAQLDNPPKSEATVIWKNDNPYDVVLLRVDELPDTIKHQGKLSTRKLEGEAKWFSVGYPEGE